MAADAVYTATATPEELLHRDRFRLVAPLYQRPFEWEEQHFRKLANDVISLFQDRRANPAIRSRFLLGNVVLKLRLGPNEPLKPQVFNNVNWPSQMRDSSCDIIDGQQRLTSLLILYAVLHDELLAQARACTAKGFAAAAEDFNSMARELRQRLVVFEGDGLDVQLCIEPRVGDVSAFNRAFSFRMQGATLMERIQR
jgi:hypothetical protein